MAYRLLPLAEVAARTCLSKSAIYLKVSVGEFPRSVPLGKRSRAWLEHEIDAWIEDRPAGAKLSGTAFRGSFGARSALLAAGRLSLGTTHPGAARIFRRARF